MELATIVAPVADEMQRVDDVIRRSLHSDVVLINELGHHIVNSGGKRLRPTLLLMAAGACRYRGEQHITLAAVLEFIHTATLLHDDVVDASELRRGRDTANAVWGNSASVLVGDFLYSRAFQMMLAAGDMHAMEVLADATTDIAEGEVLQLTKLHDPDISEADYLEIIRRKTAKLFEAGARIGGVLAGADDTVLEALGRYGLHLGNAFQLIDDMLDYHGAREAIGKNLGDDLAEGKATLPVIHAIQTADTESAAVIRSAIENGDLHDIAKVTEVVESTNGIEYTADLARREAEDAVAALDSLPETPHREAMRRLARFSVERRY